MWRRFSIRDSPAARIVGTRCAVAMIACAVLWIGAVDLCARNGSKEWIVLNNCRLIANPANDGDSFHVSAGEEEYIFRLYLVDAPETDEMIPKRLIDQAKYFGVTVPQAIEVGRAAKEFAGQRLSEPFTVFTHMSDAMGQSRLERFYAFVTTNKGDLGEQLVRNGLARIYGFKAVPPGLTSVRLELNKLQQLENQAKREKVGAWGINASRSPTPGASPPDGRGEMGATGLACRECGADHNSGWRKDADAYDAVDFPDEDFNYDEFIRAEFGSVRKPSGVKTIWWIAAIILMIVFIVIYFYAAH